MSPSQRNWTVRSPYCPAPGLRPPASRRSGPARPRASCARVNQRQPGLAVAGNRPQKKDLHLPAEVLWRLGLCSPMGRGPTPERWPYKREGNTRESLSTRQSPAPRKSGKSRNWRSSQRPSRAVQHEHPRRGAVLQGLLGDALLRQAIIEAGEQHGSRRSGYQLAHPRD